jgi:hypothetical protein
LGAKQSRSEAIRHVRVTVTPVEGSDWRSIDFHSAMPENRGVAAGVAVAIAAAKNRIGRVV